MIRAALRPLVREALIMHYRWARADMQRKAPFHPDLPYVVTRLRDLRAERYARTCPLRAAWDWL